MVFLKNRAEKVQIHVQKSKAGTLHHLERNSEGSEYRQELRGHSSVLPHTACQPRSQNHPAVDISVRGFPE